MGKEITQFEESFLYANGQVSSPSPTLIYLSLIPVVGGVALASFTEVNFNLIRFMTALIASFTTSTRHISF